MPRSIYLKVSHTGRTAGPIEGFRFLWAYYVNGYNPDRHCQRCFKGRLIRQFSTRTAMSGRLVALDEMDRYPYVYICGVGDGPRHELRHRNLHFPIKYEEGHVAEATSYNGYVFRAHNARSVSIPALPDGWNGINDREHTRCKNFQFAVAAFGILE